LLKSVSKASNTKALFFSSIACVTSFSFDIHPCPAPDELTPVGKLPLRTDGHIMGLPVAAMVKRTFDANETGEPGEHTLEASPL
jgi:hypothetical protein